MPYCAHLFVTAEVFEYDHLWPLIPIGHDSKRLIHVDTKHWTGLSGFLGTQTDHKSSTYRSPQTYTWKHGNMMKHGNVEIWDSGNYMETCHLYSLLHPSFGMFLVFKPRFYRSPRGRSKFLLRLREFAGVGLPTRLRLRSGHDLLHTVHRFEGFDVR